MLLLVCQECHPSGSVLCSFLLDPFARFFSLCNMRSCNQKKYKSGGAACDAAPKQHCSDDPFRLKCGNVAISSG